MKKLFAVLLVVAMLTVGLVSPVLANGSPAAELSCTLVMTFVAIELDITNVDYGVLEFGDIDARSETITLTNSGTLPCAVMVRGAPMVFASGSWALVLSNPSGDEYMHRVSNTPNPGWAVDLSLLPKPVQTDLAAGSGESFHTWVLVPADGTSYGGEQGTTSIIFTATAS